MQEILLFFKANAGFDRLLRAMFDIYLQHGRPFGAVRLTRPSEAEEAALSAFFKRDYYNQALIRIGLADFERQIQKNFSQEAGLGTVLAAYMGKPHKRAPRTEKQGTFVAAILAEIPKFANTPAEAWLKEISVQSRRAYRKSAEQYLSDPKSTLKTIRTVAKALNEIPCGERLTPLAEFSEKHTGSRDALDFSGARGQLFLKALACRFGLPAPVGKEACICLHLRAGLLSCGKISNVTVIGLAAQNDSVCEHFEKINQAHVLTLENLSRFERVSAHGGKAFIIEDPLVFEAVCENLRGVKCTLICPVGGAGAAFLYLLGLFRAAKIPVYYAGNFDYKGLELADRLDRDFENVTPWRYSREDYAEILAKSSVPLPDEKRNLALHNETLASLLSHMRKTGKTASSMPLVSSFSEEIKKSVQ